jgi:hypothetical protein
MEVFLVLLLCLIEIISWLLLFFGFVEKSASISSYHYLFGRDEVYSPT